MWLTNTRPSHNTYERLFSVSRILMATRWFWLKLVSNVFVLFVSVYQKLFIFSIIRFFSVNNIFLALASEHIPSYMCAQQRQGSYMSGKFIFFQGQEIVREFCDVSGKNIILLKSQGNVREIWIFSRSGNCQGILWCVREKYNFAKKSGKCQGILHFSLMKLGCSVLMCFSR